MTQPSRGGFKDVSSYTTPEAVERLSTWYTLYKEREFFDFVLRRLEVPSAGRILEVGGGAGLQGTVLKKRFGDRYLHSDYSAPAVERARQLGLESQVADGLNLPFADSSIAAILAVGVSTIINDEPTRVRQFKELARVLSPNAVAVLVTGRMTYLSKTRGLHSLNRNNVNTLKACGFEIERYTSWGLFPGRIWKAWNHRLLGQVESVVSALDFGARRVVVARRR